MQFLFSIVQHTDTVWRNKMEHPVDDYNELRVIIFLSEWKSIWILSRIPVRVSLVTLNQGNKKFVVLTGLIISKWKPRSFYTTYYSGISIYKILARNFLKQLSRGRMFLALVEDQTLSPSHRVNESSPLSLTGEATRSTVLQLIRLSFPDLPSSVLSPGFVSRSEGSILFAL